MLALTVFTKVLYQVLYYDVWTCDNYALATLLVVHKANKEQAVKL